MTNTAVTDSNSSTPERNFTYRPIDTGIYVKFFSALVELRVNVHERAVHLAFTKQFGSSRTGVNVNVTAEITIDFDDLEINANRYTNMTRMGVFPIKTKQHVLAML